MSSTLAIPPQRVQLYRALWDRWIIVLRILFDLGAGAHPVSWRSVADVLMVDKKTSQRYLGGLARNGQITVTGDQGYMLTSSGMAALLDNEGGEKIPLVGLNPGEKIPLVVEVVNGLEIKELTTPTTKTLVGKNPGEIFSPLALLIFEHIPDLFGGASLAWQKLPPLVIDEILLGWVAYAYDKRTSFHSPVGLIYSKLKADERPPVAYLRGYLDYLPDEFRDAIGLFEKACPRCETVFQKFGEYQQHYEKCMTTFYPELESDPADDMTENEPDETISEHILACWETVLSGLERSMPKAQYNSWVRGTIPMHFSDGTMRIAAGSAYAREWLQSRLQDTLDRSLTDVMRANVRVVIVSAETTEV